MVEKKIESYYWMIGVMVGTIIIVLVSIFVIIVPSFKNISKTQKEVGEQKAELTYLKDKLVKLKELSIKKDELKKQEETVNRAIPNKKEVGELFLELEKLIKDSGGLTTGISEGSATSGSSSSSVSAKPIAVTASVSSTDYKYTVTFGNYAGFKTFVGSAENALRFVHLSNFRVNAGDATFSVDLVYKAYYRADPTQKTSEVKK